ncbi:alpha/beta fold hydrolase [Deltaproteobacteria bacterium TL4]
MPQLPNIINLSSLETIGHTPFKALPPLKSGWIQTVAAVYWPQLPAPQTAVFHNILLSDGDQLVVVENRPEDWKETDRIAVLVHGLTGSYLSNYMIRLCRKLVSQGMLVLRVNLRGCGPGEGLARNLYHSGRSEDVRAVINWAALKFPQAPVTLMGFSLGGNISLKLAGEDGQQPSGNMDSVVAISPPVNLLASSIYLQRSGSRFLDYYFTQQLTKHAKQLHEHFPELPAIPVFPEKMRLWTFDDLYTAPRSGFTDARDYYIKASSYPVIPSISIPALILCAYDDPVIETESLQRLPQLSHFDVILTRRGGHVGFLGKPQTLFNFRWMDSLILQWMTLN